MFSPAKNPSTQATAPDTTNQEEVLNGTEKRINEIKDELDLFAKSRGIQSISDRVKRGLSPVGIVALKETNHKVRDLVYKLNAPYEDVLKMVTEIQTGGPWGYSQELREATNPAVKIWMIVNAINTIGNEREMDMVPEEFLQDIERIKNLLDEAVQDTDSFFVKAKEEVLQKSLEKFRIENGVPISELDNGFVAMATNGYEAGIIQDGDGMLFVGAKEINPEIFKSWELTPEIREDRGRNVTFYVNQKGEAVVKQLYPGFVIVLSRNFELAKAIVEACQSKEKLATINAEVLGHMVYSPTSLRELSFEELLKRHPIKTNKRIQEIPTEGETEKEQFRSSFYNRLAYLKANETFRDRFSAFQKKKIEKGNGRATSEELDKLAEQTQKKVVQKMEELRYMMDILGPHLESLPNNENKILDMAGGAGDLGLATTIEMLVREKQIKETEIVDPVKELAVFNQLIVEKLDLPNEIKRKIHSKVETLQGAVITPESIVVAKHACGTLTDEIIENWVQSESPILCLMTCCQDKAKDQPARYNLSQEEWRNLCKDSSKTNTPDPKKQAEGMIAMTKLDMARVDYLRRHGFEAELIQTDKFPKGDVIVARRIKK